MGTTNEPAACWNHTNLGMLHSRAGRRFRPIPTIRRSAHELVRQRNWAGPMCAGNTLG
jgi:hypothetical protein